MHDIITLHHMIKLNLMINIHSETLTSKKRNASHAKFSRRTYAFTLPACKPNCVHTSINVRKMKFNETKLHFIQTQQLNLCGHAEIFEK